jgi:hypothetical protein
LKFVFDAEHPASKLPVVADLEATDDAIVGQACRPTVSDKAGKIAGRGGIEIEFSPRTADVDAGKSPGPAERRHRQRCRRCFVDSGG